MWSEPALKTPARIIYDALPIVEAMRAAATYKERREIYRRDYLKSLHWRHLRVKILKRAESQCERCHNAPATEVHHMTYKRLGYEWLADLVALCHACHVAEGKKPSPKWKLLHQPAPKRAPPPPAKTRQQWWLERQRAKERQTHRISRKAHWQHLAERAEAGRHSTHRLRHLAGLVDDLPPERPRPKCVRRPAN